MMWLAINFVRRAAAPYKSRLCGFVRFFSHAALCSQVGRRELGDANCKR